MKKALWIIGFTLFGLCTIAWLVIIGLQLFVEPTMPVICWLFSEVGFIAFLFFIASMEEKKQKPIKDDGKRYVLYCKEDNHFVKSFAPYEITHNFANAFVFTNGVSLALTFRNGDEIIELTPENITRFIKENIKSLYNDYMRTNAETLRYIDGFVKPLQEQQQLIIKRLEATPMPKAKFKVGDSIICRPKECDYQLTLGRIIADRDWTLRYKIKLANNKDIMFYEDGEIKLLDDYAKEQKKGGK